MTKKHFKRSVSLLLAIFMVVSVLSGAGFSALALHDDDHTHQGIISKSLTTLGANAVTTDNADKLQLLFVKNELCSSKELLIYVNITNNPGINNLRFLLAFDSSVLSYQSTENNGLLRDLVDPSSTLNPLILFFEDSSISVNNSNTGRLATLKFKYIGEGEIDSSSISIVPYVIINTFGFYTEAYNVQYKEVEIINSFETAGGHTPGAAADCENAQVCTLCGKAFIPALGHDFVIVTTPAACETDGAVTTTCSRCDYNDVVAIPALGHDWDSGVVTLAPTEQAEGVKTFTCSLCADTRTESIPKLVLASISITTPPGKVTYIIGENLDLTGLVVTAYYEDGSNASLDSYIASPSNGAALNAAGTQDVTISHTVNGIEKTVSFSITVTAPQPALLTVSVSTPNIVESLAAYLNITVTGEDLQGKTLTAYLKVDGKLLYATPINNGFGRMFIDTAPVAGDYELVVIAGDKTAEGSCPIKVEVYNSDIWVMKIAVIDGYVVLTFDETISAKDGTFNNEVKLNNKPVTCKLGADGKSLITNVKETGLSDGTNVFSASGIMYPRLYPSYSLSFTSEITK